MIFLKNVLRKVIADVRNIISLYILYIVVFIKIYRFWERERNSIFKL